MPFGSAAVSFKLEGDGKLIVTKSDGYKTYPLDINIDGYKVSCDGRKIILWGHPKKFNESNPQDSNAILIFLQTDVTKTYGFSKGIFGVNYLAEKNVAYIGSGGGYYLNLKTGAIENVQGSVDMSNDEFYEKCKKDKSWEFSRYE